MSNFMFDPKEEDRAEEVLPMATPGESISNKDIQILTSRIGV